MTDSLEYAMCLHGLSWHKWFFQKYDEAESLKAQLEEENITLKTVLSSIFMMIKEKLNWYQLQLR